MKQLAHDSYNAIAGGMIGAPSGSPLLSVPDNTTTQTFDDGSQLIMDGGGNILAVIDINGAMLSLGAAGVAGTLLTNVPGIAVPVAATVGAAYMAWPGSNGGTGSYNSAAGPGSNGGQNLPPSLPPLP